MGYRQRLTLKIVVAIWAPVLAVSSSGQAPPRNLQSWQVEFRIAGGLRGLTDQLTLNQAGNLTAAHWNNQGSSVSGHASTDFLAKVKAWLQVAGPEKPAEPSPDKMMGSAVLTAGGRNCQLEMPDDSFTPVQTAFRNTIKQALLGTWRQSGWKLCNPAAQLTADDYDPPVDDLAFRQDGTFTVTWRGGGAHTTGIPHTSVPDYQGSYNADAQYDYVTLKFERGIVTPRDFSGNGHFTATGDELVLRDICLGTYRVPKKPNICEVTFTRVARAPSAGR
jgi:hypothetical protein